MPWSVGKGIKTEKAKKKMLNLNTKKIISNLKTSASTNFLHRIGLNFPD
jgi:hypothetical protein